MHYYIDSNSNSLSVKGSNLILLLLGVLFLIFITTGDFGEAVSVIFGLLLIAGVVYLAFCCPLVVIALAIVGVL